jgi:hypothetical protein
MVGDDSVHLFGHGPDEAAQARFDVRSWHAKLCRGKRPR